MTRMLRWDKGREAIDAMLARRHLEQVPSNADHAQRLLAQARTHIASASALRSSDSELAFCAAYDSARKALTALLAVQGLVPHPPAGTWWSTKRHSRSSTLRWAAPSSRSSG